MRFFDGHWEEFEAGDSVRVDSILSTRLPEFLVAACEEVFDRVVLPKMSLMARAGWLAGRPAFIEEVRNFFEGKVLL